jgi:ABC-2 type transport system ATP-binding protein
MLDPRSTGRRLIHDLASLSGRYDAAHVDELVDRLKVELDRPIGELSKGNRQKVGIIQAFAHRPPVLLLDEPTGGLDPLVQVEFGHIVREATEAGQTVFLSSHILSEVQRLADRVAVVRDGAVVAVDDVASLIGRSPRHVEITLAEPADPAVFSSIPELHDVHVDGRFLRGTLTGDADALVKAAARFRVTVFDSHEPSLDEVFFHLYGGDAPDRRPER